MHARPVAAIAVMRPNLHSLALACATLALAAPAAAADPGTDLPQTH